MARRGSVQPVVDLGLAVGLVAALAVVYGLDRQLPTKNVDRGSELKVVKTTDEPKPEPAPPKVLRLGVTPDVHGESDPLSTVKVYDDMGKLLDTLGEGYKYTHFPLEDLQEMKKIAEYDVIFLTCSTSPSSWLGEATGAGQRPGTQQFKPKAEVIDQVTHNLHEFVAHGGTLYASDFHYGLVATAFRDLADLDAAHTGLDQQVNAEVVDPGLHELIGGEMKLDFDLAGWYPAAFSGKDVATYMRGKYKAEGGGELTAPLLVKFPYQDGTVIFTSFHNEKQNSETELKLLRYLVFSAVTAEVESHVQRTMVQGGFSPAKQNLFSASSGEQSAASVYHADEAGRLQFVLGFQNLGAELRLTVVGPDGKKLEKTGTSTITIEVPDAAAGDWHYTVTALKLPNENFPFTVTVGQK